MDIRQLSDIIRESENISDPGPVAIANFDDGWPSYEEPAIMVH
jgi:hypothetical protein